MNHRWILAGLAVLVTAPSFAQTAFDTVAAPIRGQALSLPAETPLVALAPADASAPRQEYSIKRTFLADGTFTVEWKSSRYQSLQSFRPDGTLLTAKQTDLSRQATVEAKTDAARTTIRTVVTVKDEVKSDKTTSLKPGIVLREELQHLNLQAWLYGIRGGLKFQSLSPDGGMVGDFQVLFVPAADPTALSNKYTYPEEFKTALRARNSYIVADMSLQGIGSFFYPHHFYMVYAVTPSGLEFRAYFGEDPKNPVFQFVPPGK